MTEALPGTAHWYALNLENWNERAAPHAASGDYGVERFVADPSFLSDVVRFDLPRLPPLDGLDGLHLQCHIGTDTLSLARLGARMSGLDFSPAAIEQAGLLAERTATDIRYVQARVDQALDVLPAGAFDFVFTGVGAICWLPSIADWAATVAQLLKPGGRLFLREGHPMLLAIDEQITDRLAVRYPYFETVEPEVFDEPGTYVTTDHVFQSTRSASWNHGLGELITALHTAGMRIELFEEHRSVPWQALPGRMTLGDDGEYRLDEGADLLPLTYSLHAVKDR